MATVKKSKKRIIVPICIVLVIAIAATGFGIYSKKEKKEEVSLHTLSLGNITETVSATGDVTAGSSKEYKVSSVATVKEVYVKVGDEVKKGDKLASFETDSMNEQVNQLRNSYKSSKKAYEDQLKSQKSAEKKLAEVNKSIKVLEKDVAKLEKKLQKTTGTTTTIKKESTTAAPTTTTTTTRPSITAKDCTIVVSPTKGGTVKYDGKIYSEGEKATITTKAGTKVTVEADSLSGYAFSGWYNGNEYLSAKPTYTMYVTTDMQVTAKFEEFDASMDSISSALKSIASSLIEVTDDVSTMARIMETISTAIAQELASGNYNPDKIANAVGDAVAKAIKQGIIDETKLLIDSGALEKTVEAAVRAIDWNGLVKEFAETDNVALTTKQLQLAALYAEKELFTVQASSSVTEAQKQAMNATKSALDILEKQQGELQAGWTAAFDGIITECDLVEGQDTTFVSSGMKLENHDTLTVTVSLGKYDVLKVKEGMKADITGVKGTYTGEVTFIAPTATGGSDSSILDSVGSMAGISGLSSLTASGAGVECQITIDNPDENLIVGFDVNVDIETGTSSNILVVPIEALVLEKEGSFVYVYDSETSTVKKTKITTGATSDSEYEVTGGVKKGQKIVSTPTDKIEDGAKVTVKNK